MSLAAPSKTLTMKLSRALVYNIDRGKMLKVYSKNNCPFCTQAKNLLNSKNISFEEVKIDEEIGDEIKFKNFDLALKYGEKELLVNLF